MTKTLFVGVDGGASKCTVRLEDAQGTLLGQMTSGPANIRLSVEQAWASINGALTTLLHRHNIVLTDEVTLHAGMGLAGTEIHQAYDKFLQAPNPFQSLLVVSDAHTACLGAHAGKDGGVVVVGTGVVGFQIKQGKTKKVGGHGFPHDDIGGGAWLGLEAVKLTLQALDGRRQHDALTQAIYSHFNHDQSALVHWANQANSTAFATLAPLVVQHSQNGEKSAILLLKQASQEVGKIVQALGMAALPCTLVGGLSPYLLPYVEAYLQYKFTACHATSDVGAILMVRQHVQQLQQKEQT